MPRLLRNLVCWIAVLWLSLATLAQAQNVDFEAFDRFASSVETNIAEGEMPDAGFASLREALVRWRQNFLEAQSVNSVQIEALEAQLDALGPTPLEGETEAADVAQRRAQLTEALTVARTPQLEAVEAFARADTLIGRIDTTLRDRQTDAAARCGHERLASVESEIHSLAPSRGVRVELRSTGELGHGDATRLARHA